MQQMINADIQARLLALGEGLKNAEARLRARERAAAVHQATNEELRERYWKLEAQVSRDDAAAERKGHHVSDLEHSVRLWFERLDGDGI